MEEKIMSPTQEAAKQAWQTMKVSLALLIVSFAGFTYAVAMGAMTLAVVTGITLLSSAFTLATSIHGIISLLRGDVASAEFRLKTALQNRHAPKDI